MIPDAELSKGVQLGMFEFFSRRSQRAEPPASEERGAGSIPFDDPRLIEIMVGGDRYRITSETALTCVAVLACLRVRSETFASLPCHVIERDGRNRKTVDDGIGRLLSREPNSRQTPYEFWSWKQQQEDIHGNAYALKIKDRFGNVSELWPLDAQKMTIRVSGRLMGYFYAGDPDIPAQEFHPSDIVHWKGSILSAPWEGKSLVSLTAETLGIGKEAEDFFHRVMNNSTHFPSYFETEPGTSKATVEDLREQLDGMSGLLEAGKTRVFGPGLHLKQNPMTLQEMDFSPQMRWNLEQVSRIWRVPLPIINDLTHGTYTNSEQAALWLEQYTVSPICVATEQVVNRSLLAGGQYAKFNLSSLRRGDYKTRTEGYSNAIQAGWMTRNEARAFEDLDPVEGLDKPLVSLASGTVNEDGDVVNPNRSRNVSAVAPVVGNARAQIRARVERDGKTERTWKYALMVAEPVAAMLRNMGCDGLTAERFAKEFFDE